MSLKYTRFLRNPTAVKVARYGFYLIQLGLTANFLAEFIGAARMVSGPSMLPTLGPSPELVLINHFSTRFRSPGFDRGDLVVCTSPLNPQVAVCKRVLGLPGDVVCVDPLGDITPSSTHVLIPEGHVWLTGDNAALSRDSRVYGPVPIGLVKGKVFARVYPNPTWFRNPIRVIE